MWLLLSKALHKEVSVELMVARSSDHKPILLEQFCVERDRSQDWRNFKYEASWALEEECEMVIKGGWRQDDGGREPMGKLKILLKRCTGDYRGGAEGLVWIRGRLSGKK